MKRFEAENWYEEPYETITISLDETLTPSQNAQRYFKAYNKQKRAREILLPRLKDEESEMAYVDSILSSIAAAETVDDFKEIETELIDLGLLKKQKERVGGKKKDEVPFREFEVSGFKIYAGRNNVQNDRLLRASSPLDTWLHTQKYHSSHVIIASGGQAIPDDVLLCAAQICAYYSDGRSGDKIPVDYCLKKYVKKPNKAKAGFVVYTDYKTVLVTPKLP
jgi:predicted ribosome quality control (RQC) complex YloA/Tae2 family protein